MYDSYGFCLAMSVKYGRLRGDRRGWCNAKVARLSEAGAGGCDLKTENGIFFFLCIKIFGEVEFFET